MNDTRDDLPEPDPGARLINRIVERDARPADYDAFGQLASTAPTRWSELLAALRDDDALHLALDESLGAAERVELPVPAARGGLLRAVQPWGGVTGWLAAAAMALLWFSNEPPRTPANHSLARGPSQEAPDAGDPSLGGLPMRLVGTQPAADGTGVDVLYLQPVLRRARVDGVFEMARDEHGRPAPVPVDPAVLAHHENL